MPPDHSDSLQGTKESSIGTVLVVGAGVAGIRASLDLAEAGYRVMLVDESPAIGGILSKLDQQFPDDHCGMCKMLPEVGREQSAQHCLRKGLFHERIQLMPFTSIADVQGEPGAWVLDLVRRARRVDTSRCAGCDGRCVEACPVERPDAFNHGLTQRKAIYRSVPHNLPDTLSIDATACDGCGACAAVCPAGAIALDARDERVTVQADAVVLALGSAWVQPEQDAVLAPYVASRDVVTALQLERLLAISDATGGVLRRPSDGRPVEHVGWIQCAGSRDRKHGRDFCAAVCCMFALKEALRVRARSGGRVHTTVFYMDLRTPGKDYHRYRERAEAQGVRLVRSRVQDVALGAQGRLRVRHAGQPGGIEHEDLDLVVLSTGLKRCDGCASVAKLFGLELTPEGHVQRDGFEPARTSSPGVLVCGALGGPTDIATSVVSAGAAASEASKIMASLGRRNEQHASALCEPNVARELPRVAVVLCRCPFGPGLPAEVVERLTLRLKQGQDVVAVHLIDAPCQAGHEAAVQALRSAKPNRVVFGACMPYQHRSALADVAAQAGVARGLVRVVAVHAIRGPANEEATFADRLRALQVAVEELRAAEVPRARRVALSGTALVVGGGVAGMRAALSLAERGVQVELVERTGALGGLAAHRLLATVEGHDPRAMARDLRIRVEQSPRIRLHLGARPVASTAGAAGRETTILCEHGDRVRISHGVTILATGGREAATREYGHGTCDRVLTQLELDARIASGRLQPGAMGTVVMIQCVGSRQEPRAYCSRVCCATALRQATWLRSENPGGRLLILHRDIMAVGPWEKHYSEARRSGILFATYDQASRPEVRIEHGRPSVSFLEPVLRRKVLIEADLVVLATGMEPDASSEEVARVFGIGLNPDRFYREANAKWRPVESERDGVLLAGAGHSAQPIREVLAQAEACAQRAYALLSRGEVTTTGIGAEVHHALCARCGACLTACVFHARQLDAVAGRIVVDPLSCRACGACAVACPSGAARICGMGDKQLMAVLDAVLADVPVVEHKVNGELR